MSDDAQDLLLVRREPPLAWITVNRPAAHNALNREVWRRIALAMRELANVVDVRVVVLRGAGEAAFISGADISEFQELRANAEMTAAYDRLSAETWNALSAAPQPVIAMINGLCFGGGVSVALACDIRIAADHARFAVPATRLGLSYPMEGGVERLVQVVGPTHAADILLSARTLDASEALRIGMINRVVPGSELAAVTRDYALRMAEGAPLTLAAHKRLIWQSLRPSSERDAAAIRHAMARCFNSADYQEGVNAFLAKRKPRFEGR